MEQFRKYIPYITVVASLLVVFFMWLDNRRKEEKHALEMTLQHKQLELLLKQQQNG